MHDDTMTHSAALRALKDERDRYHDAILTAYEEGIPVGVLVRALGFGSVRKAIGEEAVDEFDDGRARNPSGAPTMLRPARPARPKRAPVPGATPAAMPRRAH